MRDTWTMGLCLLFIGCSNGHSDDTDDTGQSRPVEIRAMAWNVQLLGTVGSEQYEATKSILVRLNPDVIAFNEIEDFEATTLRTLTDDLGYSASFLPTYNPFGSLRNAVVSRYPIIASSAHSSADLSGQTSANDTTRLPVEVRIDVPNVRQELIVIGQHWKAGPYSDDGFRRTVDGLRVGQVGQRWNVDSDYVLVMGDVNAEISTMPDTPSSFNRPPNGLPSSYVLGDDLGAVLADEGFVNDPFRPLLGQGYAIVDASQADGREATRPASERRLDYIFGSKPVMDAVIASEVYDARDEQMSSLPKTGDAPARDASDKASDHLPVVVDFLMSDF